jgi:hypothetical protein
MCVCVCVYVCVLIVFHVDSQDGAQFFLSRLFVCIG